MASDSMETARTVWKIYSMMTLGADEHKEVTTASVPNAKQGGDILATVTLIQVTCINRMAIWDKIQSCVRRELEAFQTILVHRCEQDKYYCDATWLT